MLLLSACGGSGGGKLPLATPPVQTDDPGPGGPTVTVSGTITFQRIGFNSGVGNGLNASAPTTAPARGVVVEALAPATRAVLATTVTDASGAYTLNVPASTMVQISAKAQMLQTGTAPTWNVQVLNNANGDALYTLETSAFNSGTSAPIDRNLVAATGFNGSTYTGTRAAAPFAILDTIFAAQQLVVSGDANTVFPPLNVYWSDQNRTTNPRFCVDDGDIGTSFYLSEAGSDDCSTVAPGIYLVGAFDGGSGDTDEFDQHVIAHEYGHYVEDKFSRSDSIGGPHGLGDLLDLRVAFGEGWGNAISAMTLNDPQYRDSFDGVGNDFGFNLEDEPDPSPGWYSETSVGKLIWDLFDAARLAEPGDTVSSGFAPIYAAMTSEQRDTDALTSVFSFLKGYGDANPSAAAGVSLLRAQLQISGTGEFGSGESNSGGDASVLPVYRTVMLNAASQVVCVNAANGDEGNKLGYRKFFTLQLPANSTVSVNVIAAVDPGNVNSVAATDPDIFIFRGGSEVARAETEGPSESIVQQALSAGTYVIELFDFAALGTMPRCMNLSVTGT